MRKLITSRNFWLFITVLVGGLGALLGYRVWASANPPQIVSQISTPEIEAAYGIRFTQIAVTADGGLIDIRFKVVDSAKAEKMFGTESHPLMLIDQGTGRNVSMDTMDMHKGGYQVGRVYWMLYYNTGGALRIGSEVTIEVGEFAIRNVVVQ